MFALRERAQATLNNAAVAPEGNCPKDCLHQQASIELGNESFGRGFEEVPESREKKELLPESFDELAAHLDQEFGRLVADVEQMAKELREAEIHSEQLRHRLLDGRSF